MRVTEKYVFFWGGILSNWANVPGKIKVNSDGKLLSFPTAEHAFMYLKAKSFGDTKIASEILSAPDPKTAKKLGRKVSGFSEEEWEKFREDAMLSSVRLKAAFCEEFRNEILNPEYAGKSFVEASPYDCIWGIGMREDDTGVEDEANWPGLNLLGKTLNKLRDELEQY